MAATVKQVVKKLQKLFPEINGIKDGAEWSRPGAVHLGDCAEGGTINGVSACDYNAWEHDPQEKIYVLGIHRELEAALNELGWYAECHDPGTYLAYPI